MNTTRYTTRDVRFNSQGLSLEGVLYLKPDRVLPAVIVCHPHPLYGGSMDNNVVNELCESLAQAGLAAFKFNFRGVEGSQGEFDEGRGEQLDVRAALDFLTGCPEIEVTHMGVSGYSAGAAWGMKALYTDDRIKAMAAISPPFEMFDFSFLSRCRKPVLMVTGSQDDISPTAKTQKACADHALILSCKIVAGADHSWSGYESLAAGPVTQFFTDKLCP